jgi:hypothetical protein
MLVHRLLRRFAFLHAFGEDVGGGGAGISPPADTGATPAAAPPADVAPPAAAPASDAPATMLDAINRHFAPTPTPAPAPGPTDPLALGQPRDELGRFAPKNADGTPAVQPPAAAAPGAPAAQPPAAPAVPGQQPPAKAPGVTDADLQEPEGLSPKAQERFQKLANGIRERDTQIETLSNQVDYVRETFQQQGIQREQFEQAAGVIGMINRGQFAEAAEILHEQLRHLAVLAGRPVAQVDALQDYPDLRQAVDGMQLSEAHALEMARSRRTQHLMQQRQQQQEQAQQSTQQQHQAVQHGTLAVDRLCKQLAATDVDFPAIEARLLPVLSQLLADVPPQRWANVVKTQYDLIKSTAMGAARPPAAALTAPAAPVLRPTGAGSPAQVPKTMHEAMWGRAPSA